MVNCCICVYWKPKIWKDWQYIDENAYCEIQRYNQNRNNHCVKGSITSNEKYMPEKKRQDAIIHANRMFNIGDNADGTKHLRSHQWEAYNRYKDSEKICLGFSMGVGKTATLLAIVAYKFQEKQINQLLIIAPNEVHTQWAEQQIPEWLPVKYDIQCLYGRGGNRKAYSFTDEDDVLRIVCINYDTFSSSDKWKDIGEWARSTETMVVLDECTFIKNPTANRSFNILYAAFNDTVMKRNQIVSSNKICKYRAVMTGTPVTNGACDIWSIMQFIQPNYFGMNYYHFKGHYSLLYTLQLANGKHTSIPVTEKIWDAVHKMSYDTAVTTFGITLDVYNFIIKQDKWQGPYRNVEKLKEILDKDWIFRKLEDVEDMPAITYEVRELNMSVEIESAYKNMTNNLLVEYEGVEMTALTMMTCVVRLQQISSGFVYGMKIDDEVEDILPNQVQWIGKSNPKLDALYRDIEGCDKPCIVLTRFTAEADRIYNDLLSKGYKVCLMTGWKRVGTVEEFQNNEYDIMVANCNVVARGFNLQNSHVIMFYSNTYSLETRLQAEGRIFRLGQKHPCLYIDYCYKDATTDNDIIACLRNKRSLLEYIRSVKDIKEIL